jgi:hypothetical protein
MNAPRGERRNKSVLQHETLKSRFYIMRQNGLCRGQNWSWELGTEKAWLVGRDGPGRT